MARSNDAVAAMLLEFAELLAISGDPPYKVRAYEKAAQAVEGHPAELATLSESELDELPNVGSHLAHKIREFLDTGSVAELDELRARVPTGLRALLTIPGLGPRRAHQVYDELGITSPDDLLAALHEHRLRELRGWGARSEDNLAAAVREAHSAGERARLGLALGLAEQLLERLRALPGVQRTAYAGSLRRMRDTIGDIDLLVASASEAAEPIMRAVTELPVVERVISHGPTKTSVLTATGLQVDVRVVPPPSWGAALLYFTGSKAHNIRLRELAARAGLKLSEYGLFDVETGERVAGQTEEEVYARLGLPWIEPTLREDTGEVAAALEGTLPRVVTRADLRGDLHSHTDLTGGVAPLRDMVAAAAAEGHEYFAITDHAPLPHLLRMTPEQALAQRRHLRQLRRESGPALLHGAELNIQPDGSLDWDTEFLSEFDVVVAAVHSHFDQPRDELTARLVRAMEHPCVNVIGHPTSRVIGGRPPIDVDLDEVFRAAARTGTALEVNSLPERLDLSGELVRRARHFGVRFAVSSDARSVTQLDNLRFGVATAQRGWATRPDVINTYPLDDLRRFLAKHAHAPAVR